MFSTGFRTKPEIVHPAAMIFVQHCFGSSCEVCNRCGATRMAFPVLAYPCSMKSLRSGIEKALSGQGIEHLPRQGWSARSGATGLSGSGCQKGARRNRVRQHRAGVVSDLADPALAPDQRRKPE
jgi:hypothetical protein